MGKGKIIGGTVLIVIGVLTMSWGTYIQGIQSSNIQQCKSFTGELTQLFDSETSDICQRAPSFVMISWIAMVSGIVLIVIGGVLTAVGVIRKPVQLGAAASIGVSSGERSQVEGDHERHQEELHESDNSRSSYRRDSLSMADELSKLVKLKEEGALSEEEFTRIKKNLLDEKG
jgi:hypothetical protein